MQVRKQIPPFKRYELPKTLVTHIFGVYVVVAPDTGNWLVLNSQEELEFYRLLEKYTLEKARQLYPYDLSYARRVLIELEAKEFERVDVQVKDMPKSMHLHLTNRCNLSCPHCYMDSGSSLDNELSTEEVLNLLLEFRRFGGERLILTGGEIALRKDLQLIVQTASDAGLLIQLLTNGTLWTRSKIEQIAPYVKQVQISIDGYNDEENAKVRGVGNYARALLAVEHFLHCGVFVEIAITPAMDGTLELQKDKYIQFMQELLARYGETNFSVKISGEILDGRDLKFSAEARKKRERIVEQIYIEAFGGELEDPFVEFHRNLGIEDNCIYGNVNITADGKVYTCPNSSALHPISDVRVDSMEVIMQHSDEAKRISQINEIEPCRSCELRHICGGDCRIKYFSMLSEGVASLEGGLRPRRLCTPKHKESVYQLMIKVNDRLYR